MDKRRAGGLFLVMALFGFITSGIVYASILVDTRGHLDKIDEFCYNIPVELEREDAVISATLLIPKNVTGPTPAVILQHGMGSRKENMLGFALTFVERGFIALITDLRGHGQSTGYSTFGQKEAGDIIYAMEYLKEEVHGSTIGGQAILIHDIGLVGHSLGALTMSLASYQSGANSCVAIAPPGNLLSEIDDYADLSVDEIGSMLPTIVEIDQNYLNNISLSLLFENRSGDAPYPKNYLVMTSDEDITVSTDGVYEFFKGLVNESEPEPFQLYGNFETQNATQFNKYFGFDHGKQQYVDQNKNITQDAILWTEQALNWTVNEGEPVVIPDIVDNMVAFRENWDELRNTFFLSTFFLLLVFLGVFFFYHGTRQSKETTEEHEVPRKNREIEQNSVETSKVVRGTERTGLKEIFRFTLGERQFIRFLALACGFSAIAGWLWSFDFHIIRILLLTPFLAFLYPLVLAVLVSRVLILKDIKWEPLLVNAGFGVALALYFSLGQQLMVEYAKMEWLYYSFSIPLIQGGAVFLFTLLFVIYELGLTQTWNKVTEQAHPALQAFLPLIIFPLITGLFSLIFFGIRGFLGVNIHFAGMFIPVGFLFVFIPVLLSFLTECLNLFIRPIDHDSTFGAIAVSMSISWLLANMLVLV